jgi:hypothetical protein
MAGPRSAESRFAKQTKLSTPQMELPVELSVCFDRAAVRLGSQFRSTMKRAVLAGILAVTLLAGGAVAQIPPTDRRMIPPRSIQLSAQQDYVIKENLKDMHIQQVPRTKEIRIGEKVSSEIGLHEFPPLVVEKVPKVKTYKFFITENQIVLVSPQNEIADIIK